VRAVIGDLMLLEYRGFNDMQFKWVDRFSDDVAPLERKIRGV